MTDLVEHVARAICGDRRSWHDVQGSELDRYEKQAREAIRIVLEEATKSVLSLENSKQAGFYDTPYYAAIGDAVQAIGTLIQQE